MFLSYAALLLDVITAGLVYFTLFSLPGYVSPSLAGPKLPFTRHQVHRRTRTIAHAFLTRNVTSERHFLHKKLAVLAHGGNRSTGSLYNDKKIINESYHAINNVIESRLAGLQSEA